jgi:GNAT superfamily N-acetyltransferase
MAALHVRAWRAAYAGVMPDAFLAGLLVEEREATWRRSLTVPELAPAERVILVAEEAGAVLGFTAAGAARGDDELGLGELFAINVDPSAWGGHAGGALLVGATAWLDARFAASILWVVESNARARRFYESAGWAPDGATRVDTYDGARVGNLRYRRAARR